MVLPLFDDTPLRRVRFAFVTVSIIVICAAIFAYQMTLPESEIDRFIFLYGAIPADIFGTAKRPADLTALPALLTVISSMFLHGGFMHILGNMLFLWVLGDNVEDSMGHGRFIGFYLLCGVIAAFAHAFAEPSSTVPTIGASGAISGVIGAYLMLHPHATIRTLVLRFIVPLPAWAVLGLWIGLQVFYAAAAPPTEGGVAWWAHIGGFVAGAILIIPFRHRDVPLFDRGRDQPVVTTRTIIPRSGIPPSGKRR